VTVQEVIEPYLNRPEVAARLAAWRSSWDPLIGVLQDCQARILDIWRMLEESPPSPGYEPYLVQQIGAAPVIARGMAKLLVRHGTRVAAERRRQPEAVKAIRFLATPGRRNKAFDRKVAFLLSAANETTAIETLFVRVGLDEIEFVDALRRAAEGDRTARNRVVEIAATIAPVVEVPRGRPVSAASVAHRFLVDSLLEMGFERTTPLAYSYSSLEGDFVDPLTKATRLEFGDPDFDPRPTRRQIKASREQTVQEIRSADPSQ
jgi:hypothetical protein